ncbi:MAG: tetratricopeptide repeat protein [Alphaproteobacteria bacterium]
MDSITQKSKDTAGAAQAKVDFFVSRADADKRLAADIAALLEGAGHSVILQDWDFANRNFIERMNDALLRSARVVLLLSPEYLASDYCTAEWINAMAGDPLNRDGRLIIFRVASCAPRGMLRALAYWNLMPLLSSPETLRDVVLAAIQPGCQKQATTDVAPYRQPGEAVLHDRIREVPSFTGRVEALEALRAALWRSRRRQRFMATVVHGGGGIGKTALAQHYGWAERERYAGVWWLQAKTPAEIEDGLVALGAQFIPGLEAAQDREAAARTTLQFIEGAGFEKPWLLIYDNVIAPDALNGLTPRKAAQTLITTRFPDWRGRAEPLSLDVFELDEAVAFLTQRTERDDKAGAERLAEALGRLALALDHAAAFCIETGDSFDDYRQLLAEWITRAPQNTDYPEAVFATFQLAIEKAANAGIEQPKGFLAHIRTWWSGKRPQGYTVETLMGILCHLAPDAIPRDLVTADVLDAMALREAVGVLKNVSLVKVEAQTQGGPLLSVHQLVQMVMRARLAARGEAEAFAAKALALVADAFPHGEEANIVSNVRSWPACARLYPHAMAVLETAPESGEMAEKTGLLCNQTGLYLQSRANYAEAEPFYRRVIAIGEASYGPDHPNVATALNNLAGLLKTTNRLAEAEPLLRRVIAIFEKAYGPDHPSLATALNNLAELLSATNRLAEAEPLYRRALAIHEASYGPDHPDVAIALNNLALFLNARNRLAEAEPLYRRALAIDEASYGPEHFNVANALNNLAVLLHDTNRLAEAEPLMRRVIAIFEKAYGPDHPNVVTALNNLALLLRTTNRLAEAEPLYRRALAIVKASLPAHHPWVQKSRANLAALLAKMGKT